MARALLILVLVRFVCLLSVVLAVACEGGGGTTRPDAGSFPPAVDAGPVSQGDLARSPLAINEVQSRGDDWIELTCRQASACDLSGHYLTDAPDRLDHFYRFPAGTTLAPGAFLVVPADDGKAGAPFGLGREDGVYLLDADGGVVDALLYLGATDGRSLARRPSGEGAFVYGVPSPGQVNP